MMLIFRRASALTVTNRFCENHSKYKTLENIMKLTNVAVSDNCRTDCRACSWHRQVRRTQSIFQPASLGRTRFRQLTRPEQPHFDMTIRDGMITFSLSFSDLSSTLTLAHLHFAPTKFAGGVMIFLCGGGGQPACPATTSGNITGTITAANVTGPTGQGIAAGDPGVGGCA